MRIATGIAVGLLLPWLAVPVATAQYYPYVPDTRTTFDRHYLERDFESPSATPQEKLEALRGLQRLDEQEMRERSRALEYNQFQLDLQQGLDRAWRGR